MCKTAYLRIKYSLLVSIIFLTTAFPGHAQDLLQQEAPPAPKGDVEILESRFTTTSPIVGDRFTYFFKFDHIRNLRVHPVEQLSEQGFVILEEQRLDPQEFDGRLIQQYKYTVQALQAGESQFSPASIYFDGPHNNPIAAVAEPVQLTVSSIVDVQVVSNSPVMLGESLELRLSVTKRKPVTISAMPQELHAELQISEPVEAPETEQGTGEADVTPTPTPQPAALEFVLDQSQNIVPQQVDGQTIEVAGGKGFFACAFREQDDRHPVGQEAGPIFQNRFQIITGIGAVQGNHLKSFQHPAHERHLQKRLLDNEAERHALANQPWQHIHFQSAHVIAAKHVRALLGGKVIQSFKTKLRSLPFHHAHDPLRLRHNFLDGTCSEHYPKRGAYDNHKVIDVKPECTAKKNS